MKSFLKEVDFKKVLARFLDFAYDIIAQEAEDKEGSDEDSKPGLL